jgi:hypothetical protein
MGTRVKESIRIDLDQFKLHIKIEPTRELTLHFNSPSRRFYLSLIAFVVREMQKLGRITSIPLEENYETKMPGRDLSRISDKRWKTNRNLSLHIRSLLKSLKLLYLNGESEGYPWQGIGGGRLWLQYLD